MNRYEKILIKARSQVEYNLLNKLVQLVKKKY